jgi:SAM-dependent methyltransferase
MFSTKTVHDLLVSLKEKAVPRFIRNRVDAESFGILRFMEFASKEVKESDKVLDAGAGSCPYQEYFSHAEYESTDFKKIFDHSSRGRHDFICSLDEIPKPENYYDVIINTQVLEHVEYPHKVINEFYRVLREGGKLFLTAPQGWGIHGAPYHFYNFTKYGLESLFKGAGFRIVFIRPRGGMFWYLGARIRALPSYILSQYLARNGKGSLELRSMLLLFIVSPVYLMSVAVCGFLIPLLFFFLDKLDKKQDYTLGYACYCIKNKEGR